MKIAVIGSGGVGAYYGALLARAGHNLTFFARGEHLTSIRNNGLHVKSKLGDFSIFPVMATDNVSEIEPVDLILFCVKTPSTDQIAHTIQPIIGAKTVVMSLQNGIDSAERIGAVVGMQHMVGAATWISAAIESPGVVSHYSQFARIVFGELDGNITPRVEAIYAALNNTGATIELTGKILKVIWTKFLFVSPVSSVGSLTRLEIGDYRSIPETRSLLTILMREIEALAGAIQISLEGDVVEKSLAFIDSASPSIKSSMQRDIETGRPSELEAIIGVISHKGKEFSVPTPITDMVYATLLPLDIKAQI